MAFSLVNSTITDQVINALCDTLVHSLWQGILLAAAAGLIVVLTKKATSALRYNLLIAALALFAVGTVITFGVQLQHINYTDTNTSVNAAPVNAGIVSALPAPVANQPVSVTAMVSGYLNTYHNSIVLLWFLIICAKSIQLGVGLYGTYRLKSVNTIAAGGFWNERMLQLAAMLGIKQTISLLESGIAKVPMVIGHLKPVILIPIGLLTALSAEEVEAILVHELAHIKRRDYLVNMLQSLMEIVFFFNPAVLWISQLIKTERENCCDDMALEQSSNKVNYIKALVSCEEYHSAVPAYAMGLPGSKNTLLDRVKRMATNRNHSLNLFEKTFLAICLVVSGLCVSAFAEKENIRKAVHEVVKAFEHKGLNPVEQQKLVEQTNLLKAQTEKLRQNTTLLTATVPQLQIMDDTNKKVKVNVNVAPMIVQVPNVNVKVAPMNMQMPPMNVQVPNVNVHLAPLNVQSNVHLDPLNIHVDVSDTVRYSNSKYMKIFHDIARELFRRHLLADTNNAAISLNEKELVVNGTKQPEDVRKAIFDKFGNKENFSGMNYNDGGNHTMNNNNYGSSNSYNTYTVGTTGTSVSSGNNNDKTYTNTSTYNSSAGNSAYSSTGANNGVNTTSTGTGSSYNGNSRTYTGTAATAPTPPTRQGVPPTVASKTHRSYTASDETNSTNERMITDDLLKDGLIPNTDRIKFTLSSKEFILNGKKQSDAVFEKYKKKYIPADADGNWTWTHSHSNN